MGKKWSILMLLVLLLLGGVGLAQATYYHFEDYGYTGNEGIVFTATMTSYVWEFNLDSDLMDLWEIPVIPLTNDGSDWPISERDAQGNMAPGDVLHRAYLTMKFTGLKNGSWQHDTSPAPEVVFSLDLGATVWNWYLSQGGLPNQDIAPEGSPGTLDVFFNLQDDHILIVTLSSTDGGFTVEKMNLAGCFETAPPTPQDQTVVPEPSTLVLLGVGLAALGLRLRRKS